MIIYLFSFSLRIQFFFVFSRFSNIDSSLSRKFLVKYILQINNNNNNNNNNNSNNNGCDNSNDDIIFCF